MKIIKKINDLTIGKIKYWYFEPITVIIKSSWSHYKLCDQCIYPDQPDISVSIYTGYYCKRCHHVKRIYKSRAAKQRWDNYESKNS